MTVSGSAGGGEHRPEHHSGGGEGAQIQRQPAGSDALPGGSAAVPVRLRLSDSVTREGKKQHWNPGNHSEKLRFSFMCLQKRHFHLKMDPETHLNYIIIHCHIEDAESNFPPVQLDL